VPEFLGPLLSSSIPREKFDAVFDAGSSKHTEVAKRFLPPPLNCAPSLTIYADYDAVAVGNINVTDYRDYEATDKETLADFRQKWPLAVLGSLETTHGLIRSIGTSSFVFVSGIVDRLGHFADDVGPRTLCTELIGSAQRRDGCRLAPY
jgi:hypothetical protein